MIDEVVVAIHQALAFFSLDFFVVLSGNRFLPLAWPPITLKVLKVFVCLFFWTLKIEKKNECVLLLEIILGGIQERHEFSKFEGPPNDRNEVAGQIGKIEVTSVKTGSSIIKLILPKLAK